jgi:uncharacterized protein
MDKVVHFEVPFDDGKRAKSFYKDTFGWEVNEWPEFDYTGVRTVAVDKKMTPMEPGAINGGMYKRDSKMPHPQIFRNVKDIDATLKKVKENGGEVVREKTPIKTMGFVANFKDSEGNILGLFQEAIKP